MISFLLPCSPVLTLVALGWVAIEVLGPFVKDQFDHSFVPARRRIIQRDAGRRDDRFAQEGGNLDHLACLRQTGSRPIPHKDRPHEDIAGDPNAMFFTWRHPDGPSGRHHPASRAACHGHHAAQRVNQLCARMAVRGDVLTIGMIARQGRHRPWRVFAVLKSTLSVHFEMINVVPA